MRERENASADTDNSVYFGVLLADEGFQCVREVVHRDRTWNKEDIEMRIMSCFERVLGRNPIE